MWSAWLAPYFEQPTLKDAMWILPEKRPLDDDARGRRVSGSNGDWASPDPGFANADITAGSPRTPRTTASAGPAARRRALRRGLRDRGQRPPMPSAALPEHVYGPSYENWIVQKRVPASYAACNSGTAIQLYQDVDVMLDSAHHADLERSNLSQRRLPARADLNGATRAAIGCTIPEITDGLSNTIFIGEEYYQLKPSYTVAELDLQGVARRKAVWEFGSDSIDCQYGMNEAFGSTGVPMNLKSPGRRRHQRRPAGGLHRQLRQPAPRRRQLPDGRRQRPLHQADRQPGHLHRPRHPGRRRGHQRRQLLSAGRLRPDLSGGPRHLDRAPRAAPISPPRMTSSERDRPCGFAAGRDRSPWSR